MIQLAISERKLKIKFGAHISNSWTCALCILQMFIFVTNTIKLSMSIISPKIQKKTNIQIIYFGVQYQHNTIYKLFAKYVTRSLQEPSKMIVPRKSFTAFGIKFLLYEIAVNHFFYSMLEMFNNRTYLQLSKDYFLNSTCEIVPEFSSLCIDTQVHTHKLYCDFPGDT